MQQEDLETGTVNLRADAHKMVFPAFESRYSRLRRTVVALKKHVSNEEQCNFVGRATHRWAFLPPYGEQNERWDFEEWMDGRKKTRNRISDNAWPTEPTLLNAREKPDVRTVGTRFHRRFSPTLFFSILSINRNAVTTNYYNEYLYIVIRVKWNWRKFSLIIGQRIIHSKNAKNISITFDPTK